MEDNQLPITRLDHITLAEESGPAKLYRMDTHTLYIENNGHPAAYIRQKIKELILSTPKYGEENKTTPDEKLFLMVYVKKDAQTYTTPHGNTITKEALDRTLVRLASPIPYYHIFGLLSDGREPDTRKGEGLTREQLVARKKELDDPLAGITLMDLLKDDFDITVDDEEVIYKKYELLRKTARVPGTTVVRMERRKLWKQWINEPQDIAVIRALVSEVFATCVENQLSIIGFPSFWTEQRIISCFRPFSLSAKPQYPHFEFTVFGDKKCMIMTFDPEFHEASFAFRMMEHMSLFDKATGRKYEIKPQYTRIKGNGPNIVHKTIQRSQKQRQVDEDDDGFRTQGKRGGKRR